MPIPSNIQALVNRLNQELNETGQEATKALNVVRPMLSLFPDNAILVQYFAYINAALLFVETSRRQVQAIVETMPSKASVAEIQEAGEDLGTLVGCVIETKLGVKRIINLLERLL